MPEMAFEQAKVKIKGAKIGNDALFKKYSIT